MSDGQSAHRAEADLVKVKDGQWSETLNDSLVTWLQVAVEPCGHQRATKMRTCRKMA